MTVNHDASYMVWADVSDESVHISDIASIVHLSPDMARKIYDELGRILNEADKAKSAGVAWWAWTALAGTKR